jgi:hypothetical protein
MSEDHWIRLLVKYRGKCATCGKDIQPGEYALWSRASKAIKHVSCQTQPQKDAAVLELKCFICGKTAGCAQCSYEQDCNRELVSQACICESCLSDKKAYENYQAAFLSKIAKVKI